MSIRSVGAVVALVLLAGAPVSVAGAAKAKPKRCAAGQVSLTITYVHHTGGPVDHATGCVPRTVSVPKSFAAVQSRIRALALTFAPAKVVKAFRSKAARLVAATDARTDALVAAELAARAPVPAAAPARRVRAHAAAVTHDDNTQTNDNGTETAHLESDESLNTADLIGQSVIFTLSTKATRLKGTSISKKYQIRYVVDRCPDAGGKSEGGLFMSERDVRTTGGVTFTQTSTYKADVVIQFNDSARVGSVDIKGNWTFDVSSANSHRSVSGGSSASNYHETDGRSLVDLSETVATGTDDAIATGGKPLGVYISEVLAHDNIEKLISAARSYPEGGGCVHIVPNDATVHVKPGGTVAIVAHLTDHHDATFSGPMTAINTSSRVAPTETLADTDATFTYTAPSDAKAGDTDVVRLTHTSRRGKSHDAAVNVVVDGGVLPQRFTGTWSTTLSFTAGVTYVQTVQGTATFQLNPLFPPSYGTFTSLPYDVVSASVDWQLTAGAGCSDQGHANALDPTTRMTLEDVTTNPAAPKPEPQPFYYAIRAEGDSTLIDPAMNYHFNPASCSLTGGQISRFFLDIGYGNPFSASAPTDTVQKSASATALNGHATFSAAGVTFDETWNFTGSG